MHPTCTLCVSSSDDASIKIWDYENGDYIKTLKGHTSSINAIKFTPTGSHVASASSDWSIKIWDFKSFNCVRTLRGHDHIISDLLFLPYFSDATDNMEDDMEESNNNNNTGLSSNITQSQQLLSCSRDETIKIWDIDTGFCNDTLQNHHTDWIRCITLNNDATVLASGGNDTIICLYQIIPGQNKFTIKGKLTGHDHVIESLSFIIQKYKPAYSPETQITGKKSSSSNNNTNIYNYLASGSRDKSIKLWDIKSLSCIHTFSFHDNWVRTVLIHPNGNYIISCSDDRTIRVIDIKVSVYGRDMFFTLCINYIFLFFDKKSNRCLRTIKDAHKHFIASIAMHYSQPILISGSVDYTIKCWALD